MKRSKQVLENRKERIYTFDENSHAMLNVPGCRPIHRIHTHVPAHTYIQTAAESYPFQENIG